MGHQATISLDCALETSTMFGSILRYSSRGHQEVGFGKVLILDQDNFALNGYIHFFPFFDIIRGRTRNGIKDTISCPSP